MIVDVHAHFVPQKLLDALGRSQALFPNVELLHENGSYKLGFAGGALTRAVRTLRATAACPPTRRSGFFRRFHGQFLFLVTGRSHIRTKPALS